eukprot:COSAG01_NODE_2288_length_7985_cov_72.289120_8_plen_69_part_00
MTVFYPFSTHDGLWGTFTHDGLGCATLVRRFKTYLKPSHKVTPPHNSNRYDPIPEYVCGITFTTPVKV